jgi:hypothetical protein
VSPLGGIVPRSLLNLFKRIETRRWFGPIFLQPKQN